MAGLKDLLLLRQLQDQADPVRSAFSSLAQGVGAGLEEAREEQKQKRQLAEDNDAAINQFNKASTGLSGLVPKLTLKPDGSYEYSATSESESQKAGRRKLQRENKEASLRIETIDAARNGKAGAHELVRDAGFTPKAAESFILQQRFNPGFSDQQIDTAISNVSPIGKRIPLSLNEAPSFQDSIIPKRTASNVPKEIISESETRRLGNVTGDIAAGTAEKTRQGRVAGEQEENFRSAQAGIKLTGDSFSDAVAKGQAVQKKFGLNLDPSRGIEGHTFSKLNQFLGTLGFNPLFEAFEKGMSIELAPELAKGTASGIRLSRAIIAEFRKTIPTLKGPTGDGAEQLVLSATNQYRKFVLKQRKEDGSGEFLYTRAEADQKITDFKENTTKMIYESFISVGAYIPVMEEITVYPTDSGKSLDNRTFTLPDYIVPAFRRKTKNFSTMGGL